MLLWLPLTVFAAGLLALGLVAFRWRSPDARQVQHALFMVLMGVMFAVQATVTSLRSERRDAERVELLLRLELPPEARDGFRPEQNGPFYLITPLVGGGLVGAGLTRLGQARKRRPS